MTSEDTLKGLDAAQNSLPSDPAAAFPPELFLAVLANFSPTELCPLRLVCKAWRALADDPTTWTLLTQKLWEGKVHTERFAALLESDPRAAYAASFVDSKRDLLTAEELCEYDWNWRFKASAGEHFTDGDPWWHGCPSRTRKYYPDGKMGGTIPRPDARWRFVLTSEGRIVDRPGRFVRVAETPAGVISRRTNWGWIIQSCWSVATSFPMPPKGEDPELEDEALQVTTDTQRYEVLAYNSGMQYPDDLVMDRRGFEKLCRRHGFNVGFLRAGFFDDEDDDEVVIADDGDAEGTEDGDAEESDLEWITTDESEDSEIDGMSQGEGTDVEETENVEGSK